MMFSVHRRSMLVQELPFLVVDRSILLDAPHFLVRRASILLYAPHFLVTRGSIRQAARTIDGRRRPSPVNRQSNALPGVTILRQRQRFVVAWVPSLRRVVMKVGTARSTRRHASSTTVGLTIVTVTAAISILLLPIFPGAHGIDVLVYCLRLQELPRLQAPGSKLRPNG